jgi:cysteine synthase
MYLSAIDLITKTPVVYLDKIYSGTAKIFGKVEFLQPGGSVKDRAAYQIIKDAYKYQKLKKGQPVVEMTSGNMGSGLAIVCKHFSNPFIAVMPKGNSPERARILKALGAEVVLTEQVDGEAGMVTGKDIAFASEVAKELARQNSGFYVDQFNNTSSVNAHFETTGPEILSGVPEIDAFVSVVGSGGTFIGASKFLKSAKPAIKCMAVEPANASILKTGIVLQPKHIIQGTGYGIVPPHWDKSLADEILTVTDDEVKVMTRRIASEQGLYVGYSSGANVAAAIKFSQMFPYAENIVTILCDSGFKYSEL